ncbi:MAG: 50S ribosomal protein L1 [Candidatus Omnitrophica bacterium]|jgi:large subunit ribosomal protein L1|nr:50S ribosomal protein L1 [Candidatus Omnitrophota bacterium]
MKKKSKRYQEAAKLVDVSKAYSIEDAVSILKSMPHAKYDETLEVSCQVGIDPKQTDQAVRGSVVLPHGTGKQVKVIVFCEPEKEAEAKEAGADFIGSQELADKINKEGWFEFDCCISTPSMMKVVSKLGKVLGPRGLMPSPKTGTVTDNVSYAIKEAKRGKIDFRMDKASCVHVGLGKISFSKEQLADNVHAFMDALNNARPASIKGEFIKSLSLSTTISPSVRLNA